jgi:hypothetical protein
VIYWIARPELLGESVVQGFNRPHRAMTPSPTWSAAPPTQVARAIIAQVNKQAGNSLPVTWTWDIGA